MAFRMAALVRSKKSGEFTACKGIPKDVREPYARLYGPSWEVLFELPAGTSIHEARTRYAEWLAEVETRFAALRAAANGQGQPLTRINAFAQAGRWYTWFVGQHENDPRTPKYWREMGDHLAYKVLYPETPEGRSALAVDEGTGSSRSGQATNRRAGPCSSLPCQPTEAYALLVDAVGDNLQLAITALKRRAKGDPIYPSMARSRGGFASALGEYRGPS
jgi:hypothetical protein